MPYKVVGFDARAPSTTEQNRWIQLTNPRQLIKPDVELVVSVESDVRPDFFDAHMIDLPSWRGPVQNIWEDLTRLRTLLNQPKLIDSND